MKYLSLFSEKKKKNISKCCLLKFLPSKLSIKDLEYNAEMLNELQTTTSAKIYDDSRLH